MNMRRYQSEATMARAVIALLLTGVHRPGLLPIRGRRLAFVMAARQSVVVTTNRSRDTSTTMPPSRSVRKTRMPSCSYRSRTFEEG